MSSADVILKRFHSHLNEFQKSTSDILRFESLDAARSSLLEARRARVSASDLLPLFTNLLSAAVADHSHNVRGVLLQAIEDHCLRDMKSFAPVVTTFLIKALHDEHGIVSTRAVRALTTLFRKLMGLVVSLRVGEEDGLFPEASLAMWLQMQQKAVSLINSHDEGLRKAAVKFTETVVLALSHSGSAGSPDHFTLDYLLKRGSECPLLNVWSLEEEGIRCVKSIAQLVMSSIQGIVVTVKPDGSSVRGLPPASFMTAISVLGNLVRRRRKIIDFTLPPFLSILGTVIGSGNGCTSTFGQLTEGQRQSIIHVLRFNVVSFRAYPHCRNGRIGADLTQATSELAAFEREEEIKRKEKIAAIAARERSLRLQAAEAEKRGAAVATPLPSSLKRSRANEPPIPIPRIPSEEAFALAETIIHTMPPQEVVNFIMTRLLLSIPPEESVPGAKRVTPRFPAAKARSEEPVQKRARKSRFASKECQQHQPEPPKPVPAYKVAVVRKFAPPVVHVRLSPIASEKLVTTCCRRILEREKRALTSGAGSLRTQLLARLLTTMSHSDSEVWSSFCEEVCNFIAKDIRHNAPLAQAWLFSLFSEGELAVLPPLPETYDRIEDDVSKQANNDLQSPMAEESKTNIDMTQKIEPKTKPSLSSFKAEAKIEKPAQPSEKNDCTQQLEESYVEDREEANTPVKGAGDTMETMETMDIVDTVGTVGTVGTVDNLDTDGTASKSCEHVESVASNGETAHDGNKSNIRQGERAEVEEELEEDEHEPLARNAAYDRIFNRILDLILRKHPTAMESYSSLLVEAPVVPECTMQTIKEFCEEPSRMKLGLHTLLDIVLKRPGNDRWTALSLLLGFSFHEDEVLRGPAIRLVANKIFTECAGELPEAIERHAIDSLQDSIEALKEHPKPDELNRVERRSLLLTALCGQKPDLLSKIALAFSTAPPAAKQVLLSRAKDLADHLSAASNSVMKLISGKLLATNPESKPGTASDGLEELALEMLQAILKKTGKTSDDVVEAAQQRYALSNDIKFIIAVLPGLGKDALLGYLSAIVDAVFVHEGNDIPIENGKATEISARTAGFKDIIVTIMNNRSPVLSPVDLLVELHNFEPSAAVSSAVRACFEVKTVYKQETVAQSLQQLITKTAVPDLLMRTVHLARIFYPELDKYVIGTVMIRLIDKQVWKNDLAWEGYLRYCGEVKEKSLKILFSLPISQFQDALEKQVALRNVFRELLANAKNLKKVKLQAKHKKVIQTALKNHAEC